MVKPSSNPSTKNHKSNKIKQEPHLSGAYIRQIIVKHLTSVNHKASCNGDHGFLQQPPPPPPSPPSPPTPPPEKKQVRRRQHTSKPYQDRLLNMAEARREIVTALKFHRASMKQQETTTTATTTTVAAAAPPPLYQDNLNFTLPNQTLGLNLNFQDFMSSSSSCSSSSSSSSSVVTPEVMVNSTAATSTTDAGGGYGGAEVVESNLHHAMDDDEMEMMRLLIEQHQIEWNDTVNLLMSTRWFKFLNAIEIEAEDEQFDQVIEFPPW